MLSWPGAVAGGGNWCYLATGCLPHTHNQQQQVKWLVKVGGQGLRPLWTGHAQPSRWDQAMGWSGIQESCRGQDRKAVTACNQGQHRAGTHSLQVPAMSTSSISKESAPVTGTHGKQTPRGPSPTSLSHSWTPLPATQDPIPSNQPSAPCPLGLSL